MGKHLRRCSPGGGFDTSSLPPTAVIPAEAGIQYPPTHRSGTNLTTQPYWIPASAGMTPELR
jgi:hypothetical protein